MADQKINALPTKTAPVTGDKCLMSGAAEEYLIDYDKLATAILNKLTSKTFTLDQGTKTLIAAINELNSKSLVKGYYASSSGWKRVLKIETTSVTSASGALGYGGLILIRTMYQNHINMYSLISFASYYPADPGVSNFLKIHHVGDGPITKIRHTVDTKTNTSYIEIYYDSDASNEFSISMPSNVYGRNEIAWKDAGCTATEETVSGVNVVSSLSLS